jgi:hypothetical protein
MEPFDEQELTDRELDAVLARWQAPAAPPGLRRALFPEKAVPWWRRSIRVPLPVAAAAAILLAAGVWRWVNPNERVITNVFTRQHTAEALTFKEFRPVTELRPRVIRRNHDRN